MRGGRGGEAPSVVTDAETDMFSAVGTEDIDDEFYDFSSDNETLVAAMYVLGCNLKFLDSNQIKVCLLLIQNISSSIDFLLNGSICMEIKFSILLSTQLAIIWPLRTTNGIYLYV